MSEAIFGTEDIMEVDSSDIDKLKKLAAESPRRQARLCLHRSVDDRVHDMINAYCRGAYARPHRHPEGKSESYHVIEGEMSVYFFDDDGNIDKRLRLGPPTSGRPFLYRLSSPRWHLPVAECDVVVYHEVFCGPFDRDRDVEYAPWSPAEADAEAVAAFLRQMQ